MLKKIILSLILADSFITLSLKKLFPTRFQIKGHCLQCGQCCQEIRLEVNKNLFTSKSITNLIIRFLEWLLNFYLIRIDYQYPALVFSCHYLGEDHKCHNYKWRPSICRNYPLLDYFKEPVFLPGCGYRAQEPSK